MNEGVARLTGAEYVGAVAGVLASVLHGCSLSRDGDRDADYVRGMGPVTGSVAGISLEGAVVP